MSITAQRQSGLTVPSPLTGVLVSITQAGVLVSITQAEGDGFAVFILNLPVIVEPPV